MGGDARSQREGTVAVSAMMRRRGFTGDIDKTEGLVVGNLDAGLIGTQHLCRIVSCRHQQEIRPVPPLKNPKEAAMPPPGRHRTRPARSHPQI